MSLANPLRPVEPPGLTARGGVNGSPIPHDIGFLAAHGIPYQDLAAAARAAERWGVTAPEALLALGIMGEEEFYRALASELRVPMLPADIRLGPGALYPESVHAGIAPLAWNRRGLSFVLAPAGQAIGALLGRPGGLVASGVAMTTPRELARRVLEARANDVAYGAANDLPDREPRFSARGGATGEQILASALLVGCFSFLATLMPAEARAFVFCTASLVFLAMVTVRLAAVFETSPATATRRPAASLPEEILPVYTVIVPLYRETGVLGQLVDALLALDYPRPKLDIKLVVEADDEPMLSAIARLDLPPHISVVIAPRGEPRTKPRALNVALPLARGEYTVVYDAEDIPDPLQIRQAVAAFLRASPDVACLQARLFIDNADDGILSSFFAIEYMALFDVINPGLASYGLPVPLGGTSNHFRTAIIREVGGWDAWNVTEDADLSIRLARKGYRIGDLRSTTREEAPYRVKAWVNQRARWMKGWMQVCVIHSRRPRELMRDLSPAELLTVLTLTLGTVTSVLGYPFFLMLAVLAFFWVGDTGLGSVGEATVLAAALTLFVSGFAAMILPALAGVLRRRAYRLLPLVPALPFYYMLVSIAAWVALRQLLVHPFFWNKTEHGVARRRRPACAIRDSERGRVPLRRADAAG